MILVRNAKSNIDQKTRKNIDSTTLDTAALNGKQMVANLW